MGIEKNHATYERENTCTYCTCGWEEQRCRSFLGSNSKRKHRKFPCKVPKTSNSTDPRLILILALYMVIPREKLLLLWLRINAGRTGGWDCTALRH